MHSKIAMSPFASMLPHLCENDNNFEIKLRICFDFAAGLNLGCWRVLHDEFTKFICPYMFCQVSE